MWIIIDDSGYGLSNSEMYTWVKPTNITGYGNVFNRVWIFDSKVDALNVKHKLEATYPFKYKVVQVKPRTFYTIYETIDDLDKRLGRFQNENSK